jgi:hypothetical protein
MSRSIAVLAFIFLSVSVCFAQQKVPAARYKVTGTIKLSADYCGGADPGEENLAKMRQPIPLKGKTIYIKRGNKNFSKGRIIQKATTDDNGVFNVYLASGLYCVVEEYKVKRIQYPAANPNLSVDSLCLEKEWRKCDGVIRIENKTIENVNLIYYQHCPWTMPCTNYSGSLPPVANPQELR